MDDATINPNGGETAATTASEESPASEPSQSTTAPAKFTTSGDVNPAWVQEMTTPPGHPLASPLNLPHETDRAPSSGRTTARAMPRPELAGQYDPANVRSYFPQNGDQSEYDVGAALKTALRDPRPESYSEFIRGTPHEHRPGFQELARHYIADNYLDVMGELIRLGHLPEWAMPEQPRVSPDDPELANLSPELRDIALQLDPQLWEEISLMAPALRDRVLQQRMELAEIQKQRYAQAASTAVRELKEQLDVIENQTRDVIFETVGSLQPFTDDRANERAQDYCILATWAQVVNDPHLQNIREVAGESIRLAAEDRFSGNEELARGRVINARRLVAEFDKEFKAKLDANIKQFQDFFEHAPGRRQDTPAQTEQPSYIN